MRISSQNKRERGFSLLETMITLTIVSGIFVVAAFYMSQSQTTTLRNDAREVASLLRYARAEAIIKGDVIDFSIHLQRGAYLVGSRSGKISESIDVEATGAEGIVSDDDAIGVRFFPNGSSTGGQITLSNSKAMNLISIDWVTGRISVHEAGDNE